MAFIEVLMLDDFISYVKSKKVEEVFSRLDSEDVSDKRLFYATYSALVEGSIVVCRRVVQLDAVGNPEEAVKKVREIDEEVKEKGLNVYLGCVASAPPHWFK